MNKIISVAVPKGGVGKTTTVINLAASFAIAEKKTLVIDMDPAGACSISLGFNKDKIKGDILDIFSFTKKIENVIHKTDLEFLDFIPSNIDTYHSEQRIEKFTANELHIRNIIRSVTCDYEFIFIDCPPYLKGLTTIALASSDSVLIPVKAENFSIVALKKLFMHIDYIKKTVNPQLKIEGILLTMYEKNTKVSSLAYSMIEEHHKEYLFKTIIPKNTTITEATFQAKPAVLYKALSKGSQAYLNLATEILVRNNLI